MDLHATGEEGEPAKGDSRTPNDVKGANWATGGPSLMTEEPKAGSLYAKAFVWSGPGMCKPYTRLESCVTLSGK